MLVDVVPRFEKGGSARIRDFMFSGLDGFDSLEQAADAVAAYLPYRSKPRSPEGLKKNLRLRDGRWYWHWDPAFMTKPGDDPELRTESFEQAAKNLTIPVLLIRGKLSDVVSPEGVRHFLATVPARRVRRAVQRRTHRGRGRQRRVQRRGGGIRQSPLVDGGDPLRPAPPRSRSPLVRRLFRVSAELLAHGRERLVGEVVE